MVACALLQRLAAVALLACGAAVGEQFFCDSSPASVTFANASVTHRIVTRRPRHKFYGPDLSCSWLLTSAVPARVLLTVSLCDMEWAAAYAICDSLDTITVSNRTSILHKWCNNVNAPKYIVGSLWRSTDELKVHFITNKLMVHKNRGIELLTQLLPSDGCPRGWRLYGGACYFVLAAAATFAKSQRLCNLAEANLATFASAAHMLAVSKLFTASQLKSVWIGLTDIQKLGSLRWLDGSPASDMRIGAQTAANGSQLSVSKSSRYSSSSSRCGRLSTAGKGAVQVTLIGCQWQVAALCAMPLAADAASAKFSAFAVPPLSEADRRGGVSAGAVLAIVLGAVVAFVLAGIVIAMLLLRCRNGDASQAPPEEAEAEAEAEEEEERQGREHAPLSPSAPPAYHEAVKMSSK